MQVFWPGYILYSKQSSHILDCVLVFWPGYILLLKTIQPHFGLCPDGALTWLHSFTQNNPATFWTVSLCSDLVTFFYSKQSSHSLDCVLTRLHSFNQNNQATFWTMSTCTDLVTSITQNNPATLWTVSWPGYILCLSSGVLTWLHSLTQNNPATFVLCPDDVLTWLHSFTQNNPAPFWTVSRCTDLVIDIHKLQ